MLNSPWIRRPDFTNLRGMDYDHYWKHRGWKIADSLKPREEIMLSLVQKESSVLDIGCGNSRLPLELKNRGIEVNVADISEIVFDGYLKNGIKASEIDLENVNELSFKNKFDYIILSEVLEHTRNPEEIIAKLKEHADRFLITIPNSAYYQFRYGLMFKGRFFTQWVYHPSEHLRYWSHIDFLDWLRAMGLEVEKSIPSDGFTLKGLLPFLPRLWKNLFGFRMVYLCKVR